ncbi:MAG: antibiotic biosynthesis monooxygenase [Pseudomonadota bacterium]
MFIAMNRFHVPIANTAAFETLWLTRESHLHKLDGFVEFHMLRGPEAEGCVLYASHTVWASQEAFIEWTKSDSFRAAHKDAGQTQSLHEGTPVFEGFHVIQHLARPDHP